MPGTAKPKKIDELLSKARESLLRSAWFEAERLAAKALGMARQEQDFERMAGAVPALQEARRQRARMAMGGKITTIQTPVTEDMPIHAGVYLVQPPHVGSDSRRIRLAALNNEVPVLVVCREPMTKAGQIPVVAIGPGSTLRVKVGPPARLDAPDLAWVLDALEDLGDWAIESLDPTLPITRRIDNLLEFLDALPEHDNLHHALEAACRQAHEQQAREKSAKAAKAKLKS